MRLLTTFKLYCLNGKHCRDSQLCVIQMDMASSNEQIVTTEEGDGSVCDEDLGQLIDKQLLVE